MKTRCMLMVAAGFLLAAGVLPSYAKDGVAGMADPSAKTLPIKGVFE